MLFILILFNLEQTLYGLQSDITLQLSFELKLFTKSLSTMNFVIFFPANKIERNLTVQSRKALSKSEDIRFVALEPTLWEWKSSDSE